MTGEAPIGERVLNLMSEKQERTAGAYKIHQQWPHDIFGPAGCIASATAIEDAALIAKSLNGYPKAIEALKQIEGGCFDGIVGLAAQGRWQSIADRFQQIARAVLSDLHEDQ